MAVLTMRANLTDSDIRMLVKGVSEEDRAQAAHKICRCIDETDLLSPDDRAYAEEILAIMAADAAILVRRALAVALKTSTRLPPDIARALTADIDAVALPIILNSPQLSDADLIEIVRAAPQSRQMAVASRASLSPDVTGIIAQIAPAPVLARALANDNALFDDDGYDAALTRFAGVSDVTAAMVHRKSLPLAVTEKLVALVTGEVFDHLVNAHELPPQIAIELAIGARERATLDIVEQASLQRDLASFTRALNLHGRLTPSLLMRALCLGLMNFVEHAVGELAGLAHQRVWLMIHDSGPLGLRAVFDRAGLPQRLYPSFRAAIDIYHQLEREGAPDDRARFRARMLERSLTLFQSIPKEDLDYLLDKLDATAPRAMAQA